MPSARRQAVHNRRYSDFWRHRRNQCWVGLLAVALCAVAIVGVIYLIHNGINKKVTYNGDAMLRVYPKSDRDQIFLQNFDTLRIDAQVWGLPLNPSVPVFIYVKGGAMHRVEKTLNNRNMTYEILFSDLQKLIDREETAIAERRSQYTSQEFDLEIYHPLDEITAWLETVQESSPFVTVNSTGKTHEGRDLLLVKIGTKTQHKHEKRSPDAKTQGPSHYADQGHVHDQHEKPIIYINCGIHAREWVAVSSCIWIIHQLSNATSEEAKGLLEAFDLWILPVANPDGYVYSWTHDRMWRKNRSPSKRCQGVDLNRNFDVDFNLTSRNACSYGGPVPESEPETKAMIELLDQNRYRVKAALFVHSFSQLLLSPYTANTTLPKDYQEMERVMSKTLEGLKSVNNTEYLYGSGANVLYAAYGTTIDYCYDKLGIIHSYVLELRDTGTNAFILPLEQIKPTAMEAWYGLLGMASAIKEKLPHNNTS